MRRRLLALVLSLVLAVAARAEPESAEVDADGVRIALEVFRPDGSPRGAVVLAHGFLRGPATMRGHAEALAAQGHLVVVPSLPSRVDSIANGKALASLVRRLREGAIGPGIDRVVLAGFSAGGLAAMLATDAPGVAGYVGLDAFDRPGGAGRQAAVRLAAPAVLLRGPPSFCNAYGIAVPWVSAVRQLDRERRIEGASHCDFEWPTDAACRLACGATHPEAQAAIRAELQEAVRRLLGPGSGR